MSIIRPSYSIMVTQQDWSLHRKAKDDQVRHNERVADAIRENITDIITDESIVTGSGDGIVKVPVRSLDEYHFRHNDRDQEGVGQGEGDTQVGDIIGHVDSDHGSGDAGAGDQPGIDYYEAAIDINDLASIIFADLGLPNLEEKRTREQEVDSIEFTDIRRSGPMSNLDKRRTIRENLKRNAQAGRPHFGGITNDDLRYKTWEYQVQKQTNAVVIAMMDVSGSMGPFEKHIARSFFFWMTKFLNAQYTNVEIVFLSHHTEARQVSQHEFFYRGESGGTKVSSVFELCHDVIDKDYPDSDWNIYPVYWGDGDNFGNDNETCRLLIERLLPRSQQLCYGEIRGRSSASSPLMVELAKVEDPKFLKAVVREDDDVWPTLKLFFSRDDTVMH